MKVTLVAQVFSSSATNALLFCEDLWLPEFKSCKATASFIFTIHQVFDALLDSLKRLRWNSMYPNAKIKKLHYRVKTSSIGNPYSKEPKHSL
jgi:hypothetical protein